MTDKTEAMDLAKTLDELSAKAMDGVKATGYKYFGDYELSADQWEAVDALVEFARFATESIRTSKLVVVPDDAVERMATAMHFAETWDQWDDVSEEDRKQFRSRANEALAALKGADHAG